MDCARGAAVIIICIITLLVVGQLEAFRQISVNWSSFQIAHVLDPNTKGNTNYRNWGAKEWNYWFYRRKPALERARDVENNLVSQPMLPLKHIDAVVIANPWEILDAFSGGNLVPYGTRNQAMVWSNSSFPTYIVQRAGRAFHVYNCGQTFIAVRLYEGQPVHLQDYYPEVIRNPLGGNLRYPVSRKCTKLPRSQRTSQSSQPILHRSKKYSRKQSTIF